MSAIVADRLTKRFGDFAAVDGVSFEVPDGQLVAVLGPNGAGKTTTLEMLEGFLAPTSGTARVLGVDPHRGDRRWRARIGLVLQSTSLDAELTIRDTLTMFAGLYPAPRPVGEVIELVDLADDAGTRVGALSGGQRRRVDVAIGIIGRPECSRRPGRLRPGAFAWAATATALTAVISTVEAASPTLMLTYFPVIIVSGLFGSISEPHWLSTIARYFPAQPLADAVATALGHTGGYPLLPSRDLIVFAGWAVAGLAAPTFRWEPHRPTARRAARAPRPAGPTGPSPQSANSGGSATPARD